MAYYIGPSSIEPVIILRAFFEWKGKWVSSDMYVLVVSPWTYTPRYGRPASGPSSIQYATKLNELDHLKGLLFQADGRWEIEIDLLPP